MTNSEHPSPPPTLTLVEKLYAVHNINSLIPEKLDLAESNYSTWSYFFKGHCSNFGVLKHIEEPIFLTFSSTLRKRLIKANPKMAKAAWDAIETIFQDNKRTRTISLKGELRVIQMGDQTADEYFSKIEAILTLLTDLGSDMSDDDVVTYAINGLSDKYGSLAQIVAHKDPFPDLATVQSMVAMEELRLRSRSSVLPTGTTSSAPQVILAEASSRNQTGWNNRERDNRTTTREVCRNFGRGFCRWGDACRFLHDSSRSSGTPRNSNNSTTHRTTQGTLPMHAGSQSGGLNVSQQQQLLQLLQAQQTMLAQFGFNGLSGQSRPTAPPGFQSGQQPAQQAFSPQQQALLSGTVQGSTPANGQATLLPQAFNTMTLRDPTDANWNMDTGASSHLNSNATNLSTLFNSCMYPSVLVGDGKSIPVTNTGHSTLPTPYRPLHLNNVLITPNIVKNLISVRQFVRDNKCTIEFDEFGFSVKDYWTRQILLRCDSTGDLYPVTSLSYPQAFLVGQQTWHQRLGHPGSEVLRHLVSNNLISCNKTKSTVLCHACQLGKHVRLPFSLSETVVKSPFDIIHSDLWTSPLSSVSGIKYYVLFLDHFSHYLWVYPLRNKSDALSKFIHFRAFVKNQFQCDIKSLQCDHGGEFDNNALHQLFATNGITIRFSCPKTSQQNGKSERMIRTINNLIRTLLFQAHLPPTFWVEALHMAAHLLNILPSTAINNEIPHTRLYKTTPNYADLRVFGCLCYPHVHTNHKLEPRATPSIFLGYPTNHRGYRCLDLNTDKIILSRHVTFDETVFPYGSMTPDASPPYNFLDTDPNLIQKHMLHNMPTVGSSPVAATRQPTSPSPQPTSTSAHSTGPPTNQPTNHSTLQPTPSAPTNPTPTTNLPPTNSIPPTPPPVPSPATTQPNRNPASTHSMVTRYRVGTNRPTQRYTLSVSTISPIPKSYNHAFQDPHWYRAMLDEYNALIKNNTWILVPRPSDANIVRSLWLFRHKYNADGTLNRYKARLVANGSTQLTGIDVDETFSPVVKPATIRTVLSLALSRHWPVHQLDVKNAFLHGSLSETVYMQQPPGFRDSQHPDHVCLLQRSLYGLKQAPRAWFQRFAAYAARVGFIHSRCDTSLFIYRRGSDTAYLLLYVDDIILTASSTAFLQSIIATLHAEFSMTDLGPLNYFLGISVTRNTSGMFLSQQKYASELLERAGMLTCNPCRTPVDTDSKLSADGDPVSDPTLYRSLAGALQYLTFTRPDISYAVQQVCLYMHDPREPHFSALKRILRYIRGTMPYGLQLFSSTTSSLVAYSDADWAGCPTTRRSTSGYCVFLGNNLLSWSSKRQVTLSRSSAEAEYRGVANAVAETCWLRNLLRELHTPLSTATLVYCDNVTFNTMTLRDPTDANWNMDTGASSHLNSNATNLSTLFNSCMYPSVLVGDGKSIPVTNTGHSTLPTPYRPLHLNNVLITPNIVKKLNSRSDSSLEIINVPLNLMSLVFLLRINGKPVQYIYSDVTAHGDLYSRLALLRMAALSLQPVHQLDVKNAFLHGSLSDIVLMQSLWVSLFFRVLLPLEMPRSMLLSLLESVLAMLTCNHCRTPVDTDSKLSADGKLVSDPTLYRSLAGPFNMARVPTTRRSTFGYYVFLGNNLLSWSSKRQVTLSRSSAEAEYRGVANAVAKTCWLRNLLRELHIPLSTATLVYCDNVSAVYLSSNPVQHQRTKHIEIDIHFVRDLVAAGHIRVLHVPSRYQYADIFTKGLPTILFDEFRSSLSVRSSPAQTAGGC
ncbi:ribonuclease H-like domain-containing protein [Tanacetum coccineum]